MGCSEGGTTGFNDINPHGDAVDTIDISRVISKVDATERGKSAKGIGFPGNWCLKGVDISSCTKRHLGNFTGNVYCMPNESRYEVEKKNSINTGSDEPYYIEFYLCVSHMGFQGFQGFC